jgi:hypothetical protein
MEGLLSAKHRAGTRANRKHDVSHVVEQAFVRPSVKTKARARLCACPVAGVDYAKSSAPTKGSVKLYVSTVEAVHYVLPLARPTQGDGRLTAGNTAGGVCASSAK